MQTTEASTLFQSDHSLALGQWRSEKAQRTSKGTEYGSPIWLGSRYQETERLAESGAAADGGSARVLSLQTVTPFGGTDNDSQVWTGETGGVVRRTNLETGKTIQLYRGHTAPVPCFALLKTDAGREVLVTGSWDKSIKVWLVSSSLSSAVEAKCLPTTIRPLTGVNDAATDFIKALDTFPSSGYQFIVSAGSDKTLRCWLLTPLLEWIDSLSEQQWNQLIQDLTGSSPSSSSSPSFLSTIQSEIPKIDLVASAREHTRPINCLSSLPPRPNSAYNNPSSVSTPSQAILFSADSMGRILEWILELDSDSSSTTSPIMNRPKLTGRFKIRRELRAHETSVFDMKVGWREQEVEEKQNGIDLDVEFESNVYEADDGSYRKQIAEVWTASADKTCRCFRLGGEQQQRGTMTTTTTITPGTRSSKAGTPMGDRVALGSCFSMVHPDYVKSVATICHKVSSISDQQQNTLSNMIVVTGSSDEQIRVWSLEKLDKHGHPTLINQIEGHWHEVDAIDGWIRFDSGPLASDIKLDSQQQQQRQFSSLAQPWFVSAGLDGSVRRWKLDDLLTPRPSPQARPIPDLTTTTKPLTSSLPPPFINPTSATTTMLTEEEERELAELMGSDDEDL